MTGGAMHEITHLEATAADVTALALLRWHMEAERGEQLMSIEEYTQAYAEATLTELESGRHRAWLAEANGEPVACVLLIWWMLPPNFKDRVRRRGTVSSVYTLPE